MRPGADAPSWLPPSTADVPLKARVLQVLDSDRFYCEYQPIVDAFSERPIAYEALARFELGGQEVAPNLVFGSLRSDSTLFFMLESKLKSFQIAHRPAGYRLFINIDPHVCIESYQVRHWTELFRRTDDVVVEMIENTTSTNLDQVQSFIHELAQLDVPCALDDVGGPRHLFCFDLLEQCGYIKLDRRWFWRHEHDASYRPLLSGLLEFARARGIRTIIEGVESEAQLRIAQSLGVDLLQGYLFSDKFLRVDQYARLMARPTETAAPLETHLRANDTADFEVPAATDAAARTPKRDSGRSDRTASVDLTVPGP